MPPCRRRRRSKALSTKSMGSTPGCPSRLRLSLMALSAEGPCPAILTSPVTRSASRGGTTSWIAREPSVRKFRVIRERAGWIDDADAAGTVTAGQPRARQSGPAPAPPAQVRRPHGRCRARPTRRAKPAARAPARPRRAARPGRGGAVRTRRSRTGSRPMACRRRARAWRGSRRRPMRLRRGRRVPGRRGLLVARAARPPSALPRDRAPAR